MPQRSDTSPSTQVLLDYKQLDFTVDTSEQPNIGEPHTTGRGNGRIRKAIGAIAVFAGGAMAIEAAITPDTQPVSYTHLTLPTKA